MKYLEEIFSAEVSPSDGTPGRDAVMLAAAATSFAVAVLMVAGKGLAWWWTGSVAILSDAAESVVNVLAGMMATFSLWYARQRPDAEHPYGHEKIAFFSAGFEGALIGTAALAIYVSAISRFLNGGALTHLDVGMIIVAALSMVNLVLGGALVIAGRRLGTLVLRANGLHLLTDVWTSGGVLVGIALARWTGLTWMDPLAALVVATNILLTAGHLMREAFRGLLDRVDPDATRRLLDCLNRARETGEIDGYHQVRFRESESRAWVELHVFLSGASTLARAHERVTRLESALAALFPGKRVHITTHLEPSDVRHDGLHPQGHEAEEGGLENDQS
ncbi:MAG: cation transporter [Candidatus Hydrogenedentes bacterium]|nr:cation transporter [Candidatus Hydrogenedentota bacterium]